MDVVSLSFYALVCACLGWAGPWLGRAPVRLAIGAGVGLVASVLLPFLRSTAGY